MTKRYSADEEIVCIYNDGTLDLSFIYESGPKIGAYDTKVF